MTSERLAAVLDHCIARLRTGASVEECLREHPDLAAELRPLLLAAARLAAIEPVARARAAHAGGRARVLAAIASETPMRPPRLFFGRTLEQLVLAPAVVVAVVLGVVAGILAGGGSSPTQASTVLTVLQGEVSVESAGVSRSAATGSRLHAGDVVVTGPDARAVLTFPDGSTVTLEPATRVVIESVLAAEGRVQVRLTQERGNTWTYVPPDLGAGSIEIDTPTARVAASEAAFTTSVAPESGRTEVGASAGSLQVSSGATRSDLTGGSRASVESAGLVTPSVAPPPPRELVVRIAGAAYGHVTDPAGATAGVVEGSYQVSQITGASVTRDAGLIVIRIPQPVAGTYKVALSTAAEGSVEVAASAGASQVETRAFKAAAGQDWTLALTVEPESVRLGEPLAQPAPVAARPANVAIPDKVVAAATATAEKQPSATSTPKPSATPTRAPPTPTATVTATPPKATPVPLTPTRLNETSSDSVSPLQVAPSASP